jgi:catalase (peroxidase I)
MGEKVNMSKRDFEAVRKDIAKLMHQPKYDDGSAGPVLVRLAWYVFLTERNMFF